MSIPNYTVIDLETSKEIGIVALGWKTNTAVGSIYGDRIPAQLYTNTLLVGHNIKYDLSYLWESGNLQKWIVQGGKVWDTQLVHYLLSGQEAKYPALRDIAANYYNCPYREKYMEKYWESGYDTKDIPKELVLKDVTNDVIDTESIFLIQYEKVNQYGMSSLVQQEHEMILTLTEMEHNGMYIDRQILEQNQQQLVQDLEIKTEQFLKITQRYWK